MSYQNPQKEKASLPGWQIAYAARELRHKKSVTLSCLKSEKALVIEQLNSFSHKNPITAHSIDRPNSKEIFLEISNL